MGHDSNPCIITPLQIMRTLESVYSSRHPQKNYNGEHYEGCSYLPYSASYDTMLPKYWDVRTSAYTCIGLCRENAIAIQNESSERSIFRNLRVTNIICIVTYYTLPSPDLFRMTRSQRSRRRDKGLLRCDAVLSVNHH